MKRVFAFGALGLCLMLTFAVRAQVSLSKINIAYTQNFDSLARTGTSSAMPHGWGFVESNSTTTYMANKGDSSSANVYSYGASTGFASRNRAIGSISSASNQVAFGASFKNNTGYTIGSIIISFTVEQWRLGANGRGEDSTVFDYSTSASGLDLSNTGWTRVDGLDLVSPITSGIVGALNGTSKLNQSTVSLKIDNLKILPGATFWIRWKDIAIAGANDALAIDNFSLTPGLLPGIIIYADNIVSAKFPQSAGLPDTTVHGRFKGVVLSQNIATNGGIEFGLRDNTGSIIVEAPAGAFSYKPAVGDSLYVRGKVQSYNYLTYLLLDSLSQLSSRAKPSPRLVTTTISNDSLEGNLVTVKNLTLSLTSKWDTTGMSANGGFVVSGTTSGFPPRIYSIYIEKTTDIYIASKPNFPFNLTGIVVQNSQNAFTGYYIIPRSRADFDTLPQPKLPLYKIKQVKGNRTNGTADSLNVKCYLKGIVNSVNFLATGYEFDIVDNTGAIMVIGLQPINNYVPKEGDSVMVRGTIGQQRGLTYILIDDLSKLSGGYALTTPITLTSSAAFGEKEESYPVEVRNVRLLNPTQWDTTATKNKTGFTVQVHTKTDTFTLYILRTTDLYFSAPIQGPFDVAGIAIQADNTIPYTGGYEIMPRGLSDIRLIKPATGPLPLYKISQVKPFNPTTGIADSIGVSCLLKGIVLSGNLSAQGAITYSIYDNTGAITIASKDTTGYSPTAGNIGDSILVRGTVGQKNGLTLFAIDSSSVLNKGNTVKSPTSLNVLEEGYESDLVQIQDVQMADSTQWDTTATANKLGFTLKVYHNIDTFLVRISRSTDLYFAAPHHGVMTITGIELQEKPKAPFTSGYYIEPRSIDDVHKNTGLSEIGVTDNNIIIYPNPVNGLLNIRTTATIKEAMLTDMAGRMILRAYPGNTSAVLDMSSLKPGLYLLKLNCGNSIITKQIYRQ